MPTAKGKGDTHRLLAPHSQRRKMDGPGALARSQRGEIANALAGDVDVAAVGILILAAATAVTAFVLARRRHEVN